ARQSAGTVERGPAIRSKASKLKQAAAVAGEEFKAFLGAPNRSPRRSREERAPGAGAQVEGRAPSWRRGEARCPKLPPPRPAGGGGGVAEVTRVGVGGGQQGDTVGSDSKRGKALDHAGKGRPTQTGTLVGDEEGARPDGQGAREGRGQRKHPRLRIPAGTQRGAAVRDRRRGEGGKHHRSEVTAGSAQAQYPSRVRRVARLPGVCGAGVAPGVEAIEAQSLGRRFGHNGWARGQDGFDGGAGGRIPLVLAGEQCDGGLGGKADQGAKGGRLAVAGGKPEIGEG